MARIYRLPEQLSNLIAAGEVVERPGSVAKELIENSIDAGASRITVEIKNGGVSYLRVTDDGTGIFPEDVPTAFMRHATSKIHSEQDLAAISTMGFRGEALAAVASVARVDMFTRTRHSPEGVQITLEGGVETSFSETGCPTGTTIVIRDLFYNVPARAKFLKKDSTEGSYVESAVINAALARPDISFKLIKDGREALFTLGDGKMQNAIYAVSGREVSSSLLAVTGSFGGITVDGYVSPPSVSRANKNMQFFFVNSRPVRSRLLSAAVEQAFKGRMMTGRYPACYINLRMHLSMVDVNVHPAKLEVKFSREKEVFSAVYNSALTTLESADKRLAMNSSPPPPAEDNVTPAQQSIQVTRSSGAITYQESYPGAAQKAASGLSIDYRTRRDPAPGSPAAPQYLAPTLRENPAPAGGPAAPRQAAEDLSAPAASYRAAADDIKEEVSGAVASARAEEAPGDAPAEVKVIGEAFCTYIIAEGPDGLWLIDKHAAHERMIYNDLVDSAGDMPAQMLITPVTVSLSRAEKDICLQKAADFARAGFEIEDFGLGTIAVRQAPTYLAQEDIPLAVTDMAGRLLDSRPAENMVLEALLNSIACKAAIKAGQYTSRAEMEDFAQRVLADHRVRSCPHGRPVATHITKYELEKLFGRVQ